VEARALELVSRLVERLGAATDVSLDVAPYGARCREPVGDEHVVDVPVVAARTVAVDVTKEVVDKEALFR
jgi:hypothetical protein